MREKLRILFIIGSGMIAGFVLLMCMCLFDSDFQNLLIAPILISVSWLGLIAYANREILGGEE